MIVFTDTKKDAQEISEHLQTALRTGARALHGDIPQATREKTLADFRAGKFQVLVATDVAARGLDINNITLVVQARAAAATLAALASRLLGSSAAAARGRL